MALRNILAALSTAILTASLAPAQGKGVTEVGFTCFGIDTRLQSSSDWVPGNAVQVDMVTIPNVSAFFMMGAGTPAAVNVPGMPQFCTLYTVPVVSVPAAVSGGSASLALTIPNDPNLVGAELTFQGLMTGPSFFFFGNPFALTNAVGITISQ